MKESETPLLEAFVPELKDKEIPGIGSGKDVLRYVIKIILGYQQGNIKIDRLEEAVKELKDFSKKTKDEKYGKDYRNYYEALLFYKQGIKKIEKEKEFERGVVCSS